MKKYFYILFCFLCFISMNSLGQEKAYEVQLMQFNTQEYDEFAPVYYKNSIVFCSNRKNDLVVNYSTFEGKYLLDMYSVLLNKNGKWGGVKIFSNDLVTSFHDGPATFNKAGNIIYFTRNNFVDKKIGNSIDPNNKLGIYKAELVNKTWTNIQPFKYIQKEYIYCHPSLSADEKRFFFVSNMSGGYGGADIYFCDFINGEWSTPVNLGSNVNTMKNEMFPFAHISGKLYFSSEGHNGLGGLDIFYTEEVDGKWISPVNYPAPLNSAKDDFAFSADSLAEKGYFSSNRNGSDDIFSFSIPPPEKEIPVVPIAVNCDTMQENNYCFEFFEQTNYYDSLNRTPFKYEWDLGDGTKIRDIKVEHCYSAPGQYRVFLNVVDTLSGDVFSNRISYDMLVEDIEQVYINSVDTCLISDTVFLDGLKTNLKKFTVQEYHWDFGNGILAQGPKVNMVFKEEGIIQVRLEVTGKYDSSDAITKTCVLKNLAVFKNLKTPPVKKYFEPEIQKKKTEVNYAVNTEVCDSLREVGNCYEFFEKENLDPQSITMDYEWDFGDGEKVKGVKAEHCFKKPGDYTVSLNVIDAVTRQESLKQVSYSIHIDELQPVYFSSQDTSFVNTKVSFEASTESSLQFTPDKYFWDFGNDNIARGPYVFNVYKDPGMYKVMLNVTGKPDKDGQIKKVCVYKNIRVIMGIP